MTSRVPPPAPHLNFHDEPVEDGALLCPQCHAGHGVVEVLDVRRVGAE